MTMITRWLPVLACVWSVAVLAQPCGVLKTEPGYAQAARQVAVPRESSVDWGKESYYHGLLRSVLQATEAEYGPCELVNAEFILTRSRMAQAISRGRGMDVIWAATTRERETQMRAVPVPLLKGMMSYKVALTRADQRASLAHVQQLAQLQALRLGTGLDWPEAAIFTANGLQVSGSNNYASLFKMLAAGRFDVMLRGVNEVGVELEIRRDLGLTLADDFLVVFPSPVYFFVNHRNQGLAQRLNLGLARLRDNGGFDAHFYAHPSVVDGLALLQARPRAIIYLDNPLLPETVPLAHSEFWLLPWVEGANGRWQVHPEHKPWMARELADDREKIAEDDR